MSDEVKEPATGGEVPLRSRPTPRAAGSCDATTVDGRPCPLKAMHGSSPARCYMHSDDPNVAQRRALARRTGGVNAARVLAPEDAPVPVLATAEGVRDLLAQTIQQVKTGRLSPPAAAVVVQAVAQAVRLGEIEVHGELADLRRLIREQRHGGRR